MRSRPVAAITGAYGYVGSLVRDHLEAEGWKTCALVRRPRPNDLAVVWQLGDGLPAAGVGQIDALVHCAYDFTPRSRRAIWSVNVEGSAALLTSAASARVPRLLFISSMSACRGTRQLYGQAKLATEGLTLRLGGIVVRPGLIYGDDPGGMVGTLLGLARSPILPIVGARSFQYPVYDHDLAAAITRILRAKHWTPEVIGIAQPEPMRFIDAMNVLVAAQGRKARLIPTPWRPIYWSLRLIELLGVRLPIRADSVLGLATPAPFVPISNVFPDLLGELRTLTSLQ